MAAPQLNRQRGLFVLDKIDEILAWEKATSGERLAVVELGWYLCEAWVGKYWRMEFEVV